MSTKSEIIAKIVPTSSYLGKFVKDMIEEIEVESYSNHPPTIFRKGDVIRSFAGNKVHPSVIIKVKEGYVISINLTSSESAHCMSESSSRFFRTSYFCNSYVVTPIALAKENFLGCYDNNKTLNNAIRELRMFISKNI